MTTPPVDKPTVPPMPTAAPRSAEPIRVKELLFLRERSLPLFDCDGTMRSIRAGKARKNSAIVVQIQYEPWQRHHRVREIEDDNKVRTEFCVSEAEVVYVPEPA